MDPMGTKHGVFFCFPIANSVRLPQRNPGDRSVFREGNMGNRADMGRRPEDHQPYGLMLHHYKVGPPNDS